MSKQLSYLVAFGTDQGLQRNYNQDAIGIYQPERNDQQRFVRGNLYVLSDGMGGHQAGEVASRYSVDAVIYSYFEDEWLGVEASLEQAYGTANQEIHRRQAAHPSFKGMGCTLVTAVIVQNTLFIANVGDSRAYILREGILNQLTRDHSWVAEQIRVGAITEAEGENHPNKNWITRNIGGESTIDVEFTEPISLLPGDTILLCSDGLHGPVNDSEIQYILSTNWAEPQAAVQQLIATANRHGGPDNIAVIAIAVIPADRNLSMATVQSAAAWTNPTQPSFSLERSISSATSTPQSVVSIASFSRWLGKWGLNTRTGVLLLAGILLITIMLSFLIGLMIGERVKTGDDVNATASSEPTEEVEPSGGGDELQPILSPTLTLPLPTPEVNTNATPPQGTASSKTTLSAGNLQQDATSNIKNDSTKTTCETLAADPKIEAIELNTNPQLQQLVEGFGGLFAFPEQAFLLRDGRYGLLQWQESCLVFRFEVYEVASNDTLSAIAQVKGIDRKLLELLNDLDNPDEINVGQKLRIPQRLENEQ